VLPPGLRGDLPGSGAAKALGTEYAKAADNSHGFDGAWTLSAKLS
jgi:hypothetical protein